MATTSPHRRRPPAAQPTWWRARPAFVVALVASIALHLASTLYPAQPMPAPAAIEPLAVTIEALPPPPAAQPAPTPPQPAPKARPKRAKPSPPAKPRVAIIASEQPHPGDHADVDPTWAGDWASERVAAASGTSPPAVAIGPPAPEFAPEPAAVEPPTVVLPPRVDLAYKVFLGTRGFVIGEAVYRFEHDGNRYRIETVGEAVGLAALVLHGKGRLESRGTITSAGLQPLEFAIERGSRERREVAQFDWETGLVTLHDDKTVPLVLPTFDPLALMWQFYFAPPSGDEQAFYVATTRRVQRYTAVRETVETIPWRGRELVTERWHRRSDDGSSDAYAWLAPSLRFVPVKLRVSGPRATFEALLDSIRVDEPLATK